MRAERDALIRLSRQIEQHDAGLRRIVFTGDAQVHARMLAATRGQSRGGFEIGRNGGNAGAAAAA